MIQLAASSDLREIKELTETCAVAMQQKEIFQWNEQYPSKEKLNEDMRKEELFVLKEEGRYWELSFVFRNG